MDRLIIFNTAGSDQKVVNTESRAFIRHAVNHFYRDFAMVDTHDRKFIWERTFADTMHSYRNAVLAWAQSIRVFTTTRKHTAQKKRVPKDTLEALSKLVNFDDHGLTYALTPAFKAAIAHAETRAAAKTT